MKLSLAPFGGMKGRSLAFRLVLISTLWIAAALAAGSLLLTGLFRDYVARNFDQRLETLLDGLVALSEVEGGGQLTLTRTAGEPRFDVPYSGWYWQISDTKEVVLRSRSLWDRDLQPRRGDGGTILRYDAEGPLDQELRVVERAIQLPGARGRFYYQIAGDKSEAEADIERFESTVGWALGALGGGLILAVLLQVRLGLRPLRRVGEALAEIRSGRTERLEGDFPAEITPLAGELNELLDHNAEVLRRARTHVGNLAHALKTPIAVLTNEAAGREGEFARTVAAQVGTMRDQVEHHLSRARMAARAGVLGARTSVMPIFEGLARTLEKIYRERNLTITVEGPPDIAFRGERQDLEDLLGNLLDNACKFARKRVAARAIEREGERLRIEIGDDGPGVPSEHRRAAQKRGVRLDEKAAPGSGLGLSIVKDIAEIYGGSFTMGEAQLGGLLAILDLPLASGPAKKPR